MNVYLHDDVLAGGVAQLAQPLFERWARSMAPMLTECHHLRQDPVPWVSERMI